MLAASRSSCAKRLSNVRRSRYWTDCKAILLLVFFCWTDTEKGAPYRQSVLRDDRGHLRWRRLPWCEAGPMTPPVIIGAARPAAARLHSLETGQSTAALPRYFRPRFSRRSRWRRRSRCQDIEPCSRFSYGPITTVRLKVEQIQLVADFLFFECVHHFGKCLRHRHFLEKGD
jgi:hypothetical protein